MNKLSEFDFIKIPQYQPSTREIPVTAKVLIVCEGTKTEPQYFEAFSGFKHGNYVYDVKTDGGDGSPLNVVRQAIKLRKKAKDKGEPFDCTWAVFDKDDFKPSEFNNAIEMAERHNIRCAWSNEAFEIWYVYYFDDRNTAMSRTEYKKLITKRVRKNSLDKKFKYKKNILNIRRILCDSGNEEEAIKRAERKHKIWGSNRQYHTHNPNTTVYKLVRLLLGKDKVFNRSIIKKMT